MGTAEWVLDHNIVRAIASHSFAYIVYLLYPLYHDCLSLVWISHFMLILSVVDYSY